jgi:hypothetical protein
MDLRFRGGASKDGYVIFQNSYDPQPRNEMPSGSSAAITL